MRADRHITTDGRIGDHAHQMRKDPTDAEAKLWSKLRNRQVASAKFRRQYRLGAYILDFCCIEQRLVIEVDGGQHAEPTPHETERAAFLERRGYRVLRFWNTEVLQDKDAVLSVIYDAVQPSP